MLDKANGRASLVVAHSFNEVSGRACSRRDSPLPIKGNDGEADMLVDEKRSPPILTEEVPTGIDAISSASSDDPPCGEPNRGFSTSPGNTFHNAFDDINCTAFIDSAGVVWCYSTKTHTVERLHGL